MHFIWFIVIIGFIAEFDIAPLAGLVALRFHALESTSRSLSRTSRRPDTRYGPRQCVGCSCTVITFILCAKVHTPYVSLDTPGKATVQVVILQDPDGHEICFVGDVGFRDLSRVDPEATKLLAEAMEQDKSDEWEAKRRKREAAMAAKGV